MRDVVLHNRTQTAEDSEKDSTEEELGKLVFGDTEAFKKNIKQYATQEAGEVILFGDDAGASRSPKSENGLELADDADVRSR